MQKFKFFSLFFLVLSATMPWNATADSQATSASRGLIQKYSANLIDTMLAETLFQIKQGKINDAQNTINRLLQEVPNFKLAHLIRGDLFAARSHGLSSFGGADAADKKRIEDFKIEAQRRLSNYLDANKKRNLPNLIIELNQSQRHALVIDTSKSRMYLYAKDERGQLKYMSDYYVTIGKNGADKKVEGDKRTPLGVYHVASKLNRPLPDLYGDGAYPLSYPNEIDRYEDRNGYGIWIHGTPSDTYSRAPQASDGCVVLSNQDIRDLHPILNRGNTPVIIADEMTWANKQGLQARAQDKQALKAALEQWRKDWVSQNTKRYLSHYSPYFFYKNGDIDQWSAHKRRVQAGKPNISVDVSNISMFTYPNGLYPMVVVDFHQKFSSAHLNDTMKKRQYWIKDNNDWKIVYEGAV